MFAISFYGPILGAMILERKITFTRRRKTDVLFSFSFLFCSISSSVSLPMAFWKLRSVFGSYVLLSEFVIVVVVVVVAAVVVLDGFEPTDSLSLSLSWTRGFKDFFATLVARYMVLAVAEALGDTKGES